MQKGILWDNDGVLVDTERLYYLANQQVLAEAGFKLNLSDYTKLYLENNKGAWGMLAERGFSEAEVGRLRAKRNRLYSELLQTEDISIPGVVEVLAYFHGKLKMGIVTSSRRDHFEIIQQRTGFGKYFDFTITSDECPATKPDPAPYLLGLEKLGLLPEQCLVVEDSLRGLTSARAAGISCWVVSSKLTRSSDFSGAGRLLNNIAELPKTFEEVFGGRF